MENKLSNSLNGLSALVCGATSGIGKATAIEFAKLVNDILSIVFVLLPPPSFAFCVKPYYV